ncbi:KH domain-containing protein [Bdellovibrio sp. ArHS]|uniref:KH domain-containing protein n=1 Tax=Bdellovibrio sp. ArHS TaxID=1569284 RepID=UPI000AB66A1F|nr:KH domain-containing protein [Bdellovibrio sp. ArHS]
MEDFNETASTNRICRTEYSKEVKTILEDILTRILPDTSGFGVEIVHGEKTTIFKVNCSQKSLGHLLGKQGKMIESLRKIVLSMTTKNGFRSIIEIPYYNVQK